MKNARKGHTPFEVAVQLRLTPAHVPGAPQLVGGLAKAVVQHSTKSGTKHTYTG